MPGVCPGGGGRSWSFDMSDILPEYFAVLEAGFYQNGDRLTLENTQVPFVINLL